MEFTNVIYPTGMKTHPNEELWIDDASGKPFKELYPSMYKEGWAFVGIYCEDDGKTFINDEDAEKYLKEKYGLFNFPSRMLRVNSAVILPIIYNYDVDNNRDTNKEFLNAK